MHGLHHCAAHICFVCDDIWRHSNSMCHSASAAKHTHIHTHTHMLTMQITSNCFYPHSRKQEHVVHTHTHTHTMRIMPNYSYPHFQQQEPLAQQEARSALQREEEPLAAQVCAHVVVCVCVWVCVSSGCVCVGMCFEGLCMCVCVGMCFKWCVCVFVFQGAC
jgi:hypothetical protein